MFKPVKKIYALVVVASILSGCSGSSFDQVFSAPNKVAPATILTPKAPSSVIVCRTQQCAPARTNMTREFLYNSLLNLFDNNLNSTVLLCDADPNSRMCFENYIKFNIKVGAVPALALIDSFKVLDVRLKKEQQTIDVTFDYNMHYNSIRPVCRSSKNSLFVKSPDYALMEDTGYRCKFTTVSTSLVSTVFAIDYVDLDYGIIGANYSFGVSGPAFGGGTGYMLMRFQKNAYPSEPKNFVLPETTPKANPLPEKSQATPVPEAKETPAPKALENKTPKKPDIPVGEYKVSPLPLR